MSSDHKEGTTATSNEESARPPKFAKRRRKLPIATPISSLAPPVSSSQEDSHSQMRLDAEELRRLSPEVLKHLNDADMKSSSKFMPGEVAIIRNKLLAT